MYNELARIKKIQREFKTMGCAQIYDAAPQYVEIIDLNLSSRTLNKHIAGPAFPVNTKNDMLPCLQALAIAPEGSVLIFNDESLSREALAGDILVMSALQQNLAGLIVNGAVRDIDFLNDINFPVYSTSVNFVAAKATELRDVKVPDTVRLGEVIIKPNDWIFGDSDGLLLIQEKYVSAVFFGALMLKGREEKLKKDISDGKTLAQLSGMEKFLEGSGDLRYKGGIEELSSSQT